MDRKFWVTTICISVACVAIGVTAGILIGQEFFHQDIDYANMDIEHLEDDNDALYQKYQKTDSSKYKSTFKHYELVNISLKKVSEHANVYTVGRGAVDAAGVKQTVRSNYVKNGDSMFFENISASSLVQVAWRFYQKGEEVNIYEGSYKDIESASYSDGKKQSLNKGDYDNTWGKDLTRPSIYIVSSKTVLDGSVSDNNGGYIVSLDLNPSYSVARYVKQMINVSGLKKEPTFESVHIDYTLDSDLTLKQISIKEHYEVSMFGVHDSIGTLVEDFTYDSEKPVPAISENAIYN